MGQQNGPEQIPKRGLLGGIVDRLKFTCRERAQTHGYNCLKTQKTISWHSIIDLP